MRGVLTLLTRVYTFWDSLPLYGVTKEGVRSEHSLTVPNPVHNHRLDLREPCL